MLQLYQRYMPLHAKALHSSETFCKWSELSCYKGKAETSEHKNLAIADRSRVSTLKASTGINITLW